MRGRAQAGRGRARFAWHVVDGGPLLAQGGVQRLSLSASSVAEASFSLQRANPMTAATCLGEPAQTGSPVDQPLAWKSVPLRISFCRGRPLYHV